MLVLTRKPQEKIRIGDNITITVIKTKGNGVRLGIEAPADISVLRGELIAAHDSFIAEGNSESTTQPATEETSNVSFTRMKRSRVTSVLPNLLGEPGPLRAMLNSRESSSL